MKLFHRLLLTLCVSTSLANAIETTTQSSDFIKIVALIKKMPSVPSMEGSIIESNVIISPDAIPSLAKNLAKTLIQQAPPLMLCIAGASAATIGIMRTFNNDKDKDRYYYLNNGALTFIGSAAFTYGWYVLAR